MNISGRALQFNTCLRADNNDNLLIECEAIPVAELKKKRTTTIRIKDVNVIANKL